MNVNNVAKLAARIDGWLSEGEGSLLYHLAKNCSGVGVIVEIGSWKGKSTIWLASGSKVGKKVRVYAVDPHTGSPEHKEMYGKVWTFDEFRKNVRDAGLDDVVTPIVETSYEACKHLDKPIELIFIDGAHEYALVKLDFELWFPKLVTGGIMAFHDAFRGTGPRRVVEESFCRSKSFRNLRFVGHIVYAERVECSSMLDRLRNRFVLFLKDFHDIVFSRLYAFAAKIPWPAPVRNAARKAVRFVLW